MRILWPAKCRVVVKLDTGTAPITTFSKTRGRYPHLDISTSFEAIFQLPTDSTFCSESKGYNAKLYCLFRMIILDLIFKSGVAMINSLFIPPRGQFALTV